MSLENIKIWKIILIDNIINYMGNKTLNNYEDYKNQDYNNEKIQKNDYHPLSRNGKKNKI